MDNKVLSLAKRVLATFWKDAKIYAGKFRNA
jgi:hypothetical protein